MNEARAVDRPTFGNFCPPSWSTMVTISFLLITAVWVHSQRLEANAQVAGPSAVTPPCEGDCKEEAKLHVEAADPSKFVLAWKQGRTVLRSVDVPRETKRNGVVAYPNLAARVGDEWKASGQHREASDRHFDRAVVHASNDMPYSELISVMDAVAHSKRPVASGGKQLETTAFEVTFATD